MNGSPQNIRYALRQLRKHPGFTLFAGAALALGIGATTSIFSIADAVLFRPFSYRDPSRLVMIWEDDTNYGFPRNNGTPLAFTKWKERNRVFEDMAALTHDSLNLIGHGTPEYLHTDRVSANFFSVLGVNAVEGRTFTSDDGRSGAPLTVVLSNDLWVRSFAADPKIIGQELLLSGAKYTVIGVMPRGFRFLDPEIDAWVPAQWTSQYIEKRKNDHFLTIVGRLKPGLSIERAQAEMLDLGKQLAAGNIWDSNAVLISLREQISGDVRPLILVLLGAVAFLLLIACANVASLSLARSSTRTREVAIRLSLGATRKHLFEQMLAESLVLACGSGLAGVALAFWGTHFLVPLVPTGVAEFPHVNAGLLAFAASISMATGVLFGLVPAFAASRTSAVSPLKQGGVQPGSARDARAIRNALVITEIALTLILLSGAALLLRSFEKLYRQDPGFRAEHVLTLETRLPHPKFDDFARRTQFYREVTQRIETLPGVVAAGYSTELPLANAGGGSLVTVENRPIDPKHMLIANVRVVTPNYFRAVGMTLHKGRFLNDSDGTYSVKSVMVNETMARIYWPGADPVGRRFKRGVPETNSPWWTVVGVVADMRQGGMDLPVRPEAYFAFSQADFFEPSSLAVRTLADPLTIANEVRQQIWAVDKDQPIASVSTLDDMVNLSVARPRMNASLLGGFAVIGLLLAALGIYGVLSYAVTRRTQEIGVRVALGASRGHIFNIVLTSGARLFLAGAAIGFAGAGALSRLLSHLLFEITPEDPISYSLVAVIFAAIVLLACYIPARRAAKIDPMVALRYE